VTKVWNDADNHDGIRPQNVTVVLLADGIYYANVTLSDANNWTHTFVNLPAYNNGSKINYRVLEFNVTGYSVNITDLGNGTFIINNTHEIVVGLSINKTVDKPVVYVNQTVVFTINVTNNGPSIATNVTIKDIVPSQFNVTDWNDTKYINNQLIVGKLNPGESYAFTITAIAIVAGNWTNFANATCLENATVVEDNATVEVLVLPPPDKEPEVNKTLFNTNVTYYLKVINIGDYDFTDNVTVYDMLPEGLTFINRTGIYNATILVDTTINSENNISWVITNIPAHSIAVIEVLVNVHAIGNLTNNETIVYPDGTTMTVNATIEVEPNVDISVIKTVDNATHFIDDVVVWTVTVHNAANGTAANNVTLNDTFPAEFTVINWTATQGTSFDPATGVWTIGFMGNGTTVTLTINSRAKVNGTFTNEANVTCVEKDWNLSNNYDNETVVIYDIPDVNKTVNNTTPNHMDYVLYNITITNIGNVTYIQTLTVVDSLPEGLEYNGTVRIIGADVVQNAVVTGQVITWKITNITANVPAIIMVRARAVVIGNLTNNATVIAPNGTNKTVNCTIEVKPICDVTIFKTVDKPVHIVDDIVEWTVTVVNNGPSPAENVLVKDTIPEGLELVETPQNCTVSGNTLIWNVGNLVAGGSKTLKLVTKADFTIGARTNVVVVNTTTNETNYTNNEANDTTVVYPICDVEIIKTVNASSVYINEFVEWKITVVNHGPSTAKDVVVKDNLPAGLRLISSTPSVGTFDKNTGTWRIGDLNNGTTVFLVLVTQVVKEGTFRNIVVVSTTTNETNYTNNKANNTTVGKPICDVEISKVVSDKEVYVGETVVWTIKIKNNGPSTAKNVKVSDLLPKGLKLLDAKVNKGSFNMETCVWTIKSLAKGDGATIKLTTKVGREGYITNPAIVETTTKETDYDNNRANDTVKGIPIVDLELKKTADKELYKKGEKMYWTITVINHGPSTARDVVVHDTLPSGVKFLSFKASKGSYDPTTGKWDIGELAKGESATIVIYCNVTAEKGTITNYAYVTTSTHESNPDNNKDNDTITVETHEPVPPKMHPTGNPIVMVVLSLLAIVGVSIRRKL
jgi:uncharacterized repeat protein (TIGR01451 family)